MTKFLKTRKKIKNRYRKELSITNDTFISNWYSGLGGGGGVIPPEVLKIYQN